MTPYSKFIAMLKNPPKLTPSKVHHVRILELLDWFFSLSEESREMHRAAVRKRVDNYLKRASKKHATEVRNEMERVIKL